MAVTINEIATGGVEGAGIGVAGAGLLVPGPTGPTGSPLLVTDGSNVVTDVANLTITGGTVSGTTPNATITVTAADEFGWQNIKTDWGAVGNGSVDDSAAFLNFQAWAQAQTTGVVLVIPPGIYNLTVGIGTGWDFFTGIKDLTIYGYGATLSNFGRGGIFSQAAVGVASARINQYGARGYDGYARHDGAI